MDLINRNCFGTYQLKVIANKSVFSIWGFCVPLCDTVTCAHKEVTRALTCIAVIYTPVVLSNCVSFEHRMPETNGHVNGERLYRLSGSKASAAVALLRCECGVTVLHGSGALLHLQQRGASRQSSIKHASGISHASAALRSARAAWLLIEQEAFRRCLPVS